MKTEFSHYTVYLDGGDTVEHNIARIMTSGSLVILEDEDRDPIAVYPAKRFYYAKPSYTDSEAKPKDGFGNRLVSIMTYSGAGEDDEEYSGPGEFPPLDADAIKGATLGPIREGALEADWAWAFPKESENYDSWWLKTTGHGVTGFDMTMLDRKNSLHLLPPEDESAMDSWRRANENLKAAARNAA